MWYMLGTIYFVLAILFAVLYTKDFVKYNEKFNILKEGMTEKKAKNSVLIISLVGGLILAPAAWLWLIEKLFKKRGNLK